MRLLIDENLPPQIARALRGSGHDAVAMVERGAGADDLDVVAIAARERRVIATRDKGLAPLPFTSSARPAGLILLRVPSLSKGDLERFAVEAITRRADWSGIVATISETRIRTRRLPRSDA